MRRRWHISLAIGCLLGLLFSFSACTGDTAAGTISGRLLAVGGLSNVPNTPLPGTVTVTNTETRQHHSLPVSADGHYSISVIPGTYAIDGRSQLYGDGAYPCRAEQPIRVAANTTTRADVVCQER